MKQNLNRFYTTVFLSQLNPFTFLLALKQSLGQLYIVIKNIKGFPNAKNYNNKVKYSLPFDGEWKIINGGSTQENSHSWNILTQRYAYDFVITDENGKSFKSEGKNLNEYHCYEKEVLSPAEGVVVAVKNDIRDYEDVGDYSIDWKVRDFRGNFVLIQHAKEEYSFLAHFKKNSIKVKEGEKVKRGQILGLCGNSGHSTEPHIHFHLQDNKNVWLATGLPIRFRKVSRKLQMKSRSKKIAM